MPQISGQLYFWGQKWNGDSPIWGGLSGAFYNAGGNTNPGGLGNNSGANVPYLGFQASKSNSIYGASETVQPPAIILLPQIKF